MNSGPSGSQTSVPWRGKSWADRTFINSYEAERDLCADRSSFVLRNDILEGLPLHIRRFIDHPGHNPHIEGFTLLFTYLNSDPGPDQLRRLIVDYFRGSRSLCGLLSQ